jgi:hypothetical protein
VNAPTALRNHYRPTGDKTKPKVPLAREESIGDEEDVLSEVGILFKLTQYQTWTTSRFASTLVKGSAATELEIKNEKWLSSLVFRGSMSMYGNKMAIPKTPMAAKDPLTSPSNTFVFERGNISTIVEHMFEEIIAPNTEDGIGTDNMTCIIAYWPGEISE